MAFDLRKQPNEEPARKKLYWIYVLIAFLLIGSAAWWFNQPKEQPQTPAQASSTAAPVKDTVPKLIDTIRSVTPAPVDRPVIAASFEAGSTIPKNASGMLSKFKEKVGKINVFGYASSEGDLTLNQSISQARADAYKRVLVRNGIADSLVTAQGKGIDNPIASNDTEAGRRKNRRVEVQFQN